MEPAGSFLKILRRDRPKTPNRPKRPKTLFDEDERPEAPVQGPLFSRRVLRALLIVFGASMMLSLDWFGLLLLNSEGVRSQIGPLNALRVMAALMAGVAVPSALLMAHYRRVYSYISSENVFFAITFSLSFLLGTPCALVCVFG